MPTKEKDSEAGKSSKPVHQPFHDAHQAYLKAVDEAWNAACIQQQKDQIALQEQVLRMNRSTTPDELKAAQDNLQKMMAAPANPALANRLDEAYARYKNDVKAALTGVNMADLDPATLAAIGQSLFEIAQYAQQASALAPPAKSS